MEDIMYFLPYWSTASSFLSLVKYSVMLHVTIMIDIIFHDIFKGVHPISSHSENERLNNMNTNARTETAMCWYLVARWACEVIVILTQKKLPQCFFVSRFK